jgi:hypothetical protein
VGTPDIRPGDAADTWPHLLPAVRYARDHGHYVALHEYMGYEADYGVGWKQIDGQRIPWTVWHGRRLPGDGADESYPYGWAALRYRYVWDVYYRPVGLGDTKLLITEVGCDSVESVTPLGASVGTWKEHIADWAAEGKDPAATYAEMLKWYDARIREDGFVAGATIFTVGSVGNWINWDISGTAVESNLLEYIEAVAGLPDPDPLPPGEEPMDQYTVIVVKLPQDTNREQAAKIARWFNPNKHTMAYSIDNYARLLGDPAAGPKSKGIVFGYWRHSPAERAVIDRWSHDRIQMPGPFTPEEPAPAARAHGVDVSHHQKEIDWETLKEAGE